MWPRSRSIQVCCQWPVYLRISMFFHGVSQVSQYCMLLQGSHTLRRRHVSVVESCRARGRCATSHIVLVVARGILNARRSSHRRFVECEAHASFLLKCKRLCRRGNTIFNKSTPVCRVLDQRNLACLVGIAQRLSPGQSDFASVLKRPSKRMQCKFWGRKHRFCRLTQL